MEGKPVDREPAPTKIDWSKCLVCDNGFSGEKVAVTDRGWVHFGTCEAEWHKREAAAQAVIDGWVIVGDGATCPICRGGAVEGESYKDGVRSIRVICPPCDKYEPPPPLEEDFGR
jgi:hypothetical protein